MRVGWIAAVVLVVSWSAGCRGDGKSAAQKRPAGTPTDPVDACERVAEVCRLDESRLGVCVVAQQGTCPASADGDKPCLVCQSQH